MKEITIIIVSYNVEDLLKQCIQSIYQTTKPELFDIIVVDNNSGDASVAMIMKTFYNVRLIQSAENLG
ncbi:glycosyltransferase, partial [bacterium]|nr:glycosyltransferase [bacterium]